MITARILPLALTGSAFTASYGTVIASAGRPALAETAAVAGLACAGLFAASWRYAFRPWLPARIPLADLRMQRAEVKRDSAGRRALAAYNRATLRTAAVMADPKASPMDRYRAAEAEEAAAKAAARSSKGTS